MLSYSKILHNRFFKCFISQRDKKEEKQCFQDLETLYLLSSAQGVVANFHSPDSLVNFEAVILGSVPLGGGVSSSASLEVSAASMVVVISRYQTPYQEVSQRNINRYYKEIYHFYTIIPNEYWIAYILAAGQALLGI
jgi:galactokinase